MFGWSAPQLCWCRLFSKSFCARTCWFCGGSAKILWGTLGVADTGAKTARLSEPSVMLRLLWDKLQSVHRWQQHWTIRCQDFLLALGERSFELTSEAPCIATDLSEFVLDDPCMYNNPKEWIDLVPLDIVSALRGCPAIQAFGHQLCFCFSQWLLTLDESAEYLRPTTLLEMYVGFYLEVGMDLPIEILGRNSERQWAQASASGVGDLNGRTLQSRLSVFRVMVEMVFHCLDLPIQWMELDNLSIGIHKSLDGLIIPWPVPTAQRVIAAISAYTQNRPIRHVCDLARAWPWG